MIKVSVFQPLKTSIQSSTYYRMAYRWYIDTKSLLTAVIWSLMVYDVDSKSDAHGCYSQCRTWCVQLYAETTWSLCIHRWGKQPVTLNYRSISIRLHGVTFQKTVIIVITAMLTSNMTLYGISVLANSVLAFETRGRRGGEVIYELTTWWFCGTSTGCFTTLGHNCRRWFPRSLWWEKFI